MTKIKNNIIKSYIIILFYIFKMMKNEINYNKYDNLIKYSFKIEKSCKFYNKN